MQTLFYEKPILIYSHLFASPIFSSCWIFQSRVVYNIVDEFSRFQTLSNWARIQKAENTTSSFRKVKPFWSSRNLSQLKGARYDLISADFNNPDRDAAIVSLHMPFGTRILLKTLFTFFCTGLAGDCVRKATQQSIDTGVHCQSPPPALHQIPFPIELAATVGTAVNSDTLQQRQHRVATKSLPVTRTS